MTEAVATRNLAAGLADEIVWAAEKAFLLQIMGKRRAHDPTLGVNSAIYNVYRHGRRQEDGAVTHDHCDRDALLARVSTLFAEEVAKGNDVIVWRWLPHEDGAFRAAFMPFSALSPRHLKPEEI